MHSELTKISDTKVRIGVVAGEEDLKPYKNQTLEKLSKNLQVPGFRKGNVPIYLVEKNVDPQTLQNEFLDIAMSALYSQAAQNEKIRPVTQPEVSLKKFVPFSALEFEVQTEVLGAIKLADYKNIKLEKAKPTVQAKEVNDVIENLQTRLAEKKAVKRVAKDGDEAWIDFKGVNEKGEPVTGAEGKDYPLLIGSKTFIPGFEDNVKSMKPGAEKDFELTFPKDYGAKELAGKKVKFSVKLKKVEELIKPEVNEKFATKAGPFKSVKELKDDIKKQLVVERERENTTQYQNSLVGQIVDGTKLKIPTSMVEHQAMHNLEHVKKDLVQRGQTFEDFLKAEGKSEEVYSKEVLQPQAENQIKTSIVLEEISRRENLSVTNEELEVRINLLKSQYKDEAMQAELDKDANRRDIASRLLTEKVLEKLEQYAHSSK